MDRSHVRRNVISSYGMEYDADDTYARTNSSSYAAASAADPRCNSLSVASSAYSSDVAPDETSVSSKSSLAAAVDDAVESGPSVVVPDVE